MKHPLPYTLLLVDDHPLMRRGLSQLLDLENDLQVVGEASNGADALKMYIELAPDLVILDFNMPMMNGLETLKKLRQQGYLGKILMYTVSDAPEDVRESLRHGADGYLLKDMEPEEIIVQIRHMLEGELVVSHNLTQALARSLRTPSPATDIDLTSRERDVLRWMVAGLSNKMIGNKLGITEGTVKIHVKNVLHKTGFRSRVEAAVWAMNHLKT